MHHFSYQNGCLFAEDVSLEEIARTLGTPFYCYSSATLTRHYNVFSEALAGLDNLICYAMKANSNQAVIKTLARLGAGVDIVSGGELKRALRAGVSPEKIIFSGVAKTKQEMHEALEADILCFNVESEPELDRLSCVSQSLGRVARVSLRINPDVDAVTHKKMTTGKSENKFGIPYRHALKVYDHAASLANIEIIGIDMHIGSQITSLEPFEQAFSRLEALVGMLRAGGHSISHIDLGGGLGIPYTEGETPPLPSAYGAIIKKHVSKLDCKIIIEPGRLIAGNAGILVTKVEYVKHTGDKTFVIVDAGMNDLIRPTLYEAWHALWAVRQPHADTPEVCVDVVGPVCETGDFIALDRKMPALGEADLIAVMSAGAYGAVQSCTYNSRPLVPEVLVKDNRYHVIRPRLEVEAVIAMDNVPNWL